MKTPKLDYKSIATAGIGLLVLAGFAFLSFYLARTVFNNDQLRTTIEQAGIFAPLVLILAKSSTLIIAPLGGTLIYVIATTLFGFEKALLYTTLGDLLGSAVSFLISRHFGKQIAFKLAGKKSEKLIRKLISKIEDKRWLVAARMAGMQDFVNYAAGFMSISFMTYMMLVVITQIPLNFILVSISSFPEHSWPARILYGLLGLMYLIGIGVFYHRFTSKTDHIVKPKGSL